MASKAALHSFIIYSLDTIKFQRRETNYLKESFGPFSEPTKR